MDRKWKTALFLAVFAAVLAGAFFAYKNLSARYRPETGLPVSSAQVSAGEKSGTASPAASSRTAAPDFTVYNQSGKAARLSSFRGKPVVLNFWASWCYYCKQEMPEFQKAYDAQKGKIQFLFVDWTDGRQETQEKGSAFLKQNGYTFPAYYDLNQEAVSAYGLTGIPATVFIRSDGTVAGGQAGAMDSGTLEKGIKLITE
jgi:thiol-disulfide isomerase/thioredoxin